MTISRYLVYDSNHFVISESRDHKNHIFIKEEYDRLVCWIGKKGFIPGSAMTGISTRQYKIIGIDNYMD